MSKRGQHCEAMTALRGRIAERLASAMRENNIIPSERNIGRVEGLTEAIRIIDEEVNDE